MDLRGAGVQFNIICRETGRSLGQVDGLRAFRETHPGAVYLHRGRTYVVDSLDTEKRKAEVAEARVDYYTRVRSVKDTEILATEMEAPVLGTRVHFGKIRVTEQITGYERVLLDRGRKINVLPLDLPPLVFDTEGLWFPVPRAIQGELEVQQRHFMGGIHAVEHAAIGVFPLLVMADRNDLGGISTPMHSQLQEAAVFIYDGVAGGAGICREGFEKAQTLLNNTLAAVRDCGCENGCPGCVHSPKCGSGNRPIDKAAAIALLERLTDGENKPPKMDRCQVPPDATKAAAMEPVCAAGAGDDDGPALPLVPADGAMRRSGPGRRAAFRRIRRHRRLAGEKGPAEAVNEEAGGTSPRLRYVVFDLETQRSAQEVGGWHRADLMGVSCAVIYDSAFDAFETYLEERVADLIDRLKEADLVVGFNILRFDYRVLRGYSDFDFASLTSLDMLADVHRRLGYRLSLQRLAVASLGAEKSADGLQALRWWQEGRMDEIVAYCREDVRLTRDLYRYGRDRGYLLFDNKAGQRVRVPVDFS